MDTSSHQLADLFSQLGLPNSSDAINAFFSNNYLPKDIPLEQAAFWTASQANFIHEALALDSDWSEIVDQLDAQLRH